MRNKIQTFWTATGMAALLVTLLGLTGCTSTGYQKSDSAATSMQSAAAEVQGESRALEATMGALKDLVINPPADLKVAYGQYSSQLDRLEASARRTANTGHTMELKSAAYFQAWDKQLADMNYELIRNVSASRKAEVTNRFEVVHRRYQESQEVVEPLISYLEDIRKALSTDLTPAGLEAVKSVVLKADQNAAKVQSALAALTTALTDASTRMASIAPAEPAAQTTAVRQVPAYPIQRTSSTN